MTPPAKIKKIQARVGTEPDGFWGPKSIAACKKHLRALMPKVSPWPASDPASLRKFYGEPGDEKQLTVITFPFPIFYQGKQVETTRVHKKCADSLLRILSAIHNKYGNDRDIMEEAQDYAGIFSFRKKTGGSSYSLHAYGAAIDLDPGDNSYGSAWPVKADMPIEIMEEFAREGWLPAGAFWGYDAMHFQATRP